MKKHPDLGSSGGAKFFATAAEIDILDGATLTTAELNILDGVTSTTAELNILDGVTATAAELNLSDGAPATVGIAYAASATTDGIEATYTVKDAAGTTLAGVYFLEVHIADVATGIDVTSTSASGALTMVAGTQLEEVTAKKHLRIQTAATGVATLKLVDSANTAGEYFCCKHPATGAVIVGAATAGTDYEGGS